MSLFTKTQHEALIANCQAQIVRMDNRQADIDFTPVVKLFTPDAQCTWLLTELGLDDIAFGLADLGMGCPELGFISMREIREIRGPLGLPVERDLHFDADYGAQRRRTPVRAAPSPSEWVRRSAEYKTLSESPKHANMAHRHLRRFWGASPSRRPILLVPNPLCAGQRRAHIKPNRIQLQRAA